MSRPSHLHAALIIDARYSKLVQEKTAQDEALKEATAAAELLRTKAEGEESRADRLQSELRATKDVSAASHRIADGRTLLRPS